MNLLKIKREDKGITSIQMSRYLGIRKETYSRKENGHTKFTNAEKIALSVILNLKKQDMLDIFGEDIIWVFWKLILKMRTCL